MPLDLKQFGIEGTEWIRSSLSAGRRLSWTLLSARLLDDGSAYLLGSPGGMAIPELQNLGESISHLSHATLKDGAHSLFEMSKRVDESGLLIIEDDVRRPGDPGLTQFPADETAIDGNDVYHLHAIKGLATAAELEIFVGKSAFGHPLNGFVVRELSTASARSLIQNDDLAEIASHCCFTFHSIYDGDAIAAWIPQTLDALVASG